MTQKDKELLLKDLCARLPYKPRVRYYYCSIGSAAINGYSDEGYLSYQNLEDFSIYPKYGLEKTRVYNILPYLRPMSSMTEEEKEEISELLDASIEIDSDGDITYFGGYSIIPCSDYQIYIDYLISHHFDFRGLIPMGLAIEAPEGMYKINTK